jgi:prolyl oligopeptidase
MRMFKHHWLHIFALLGLIAGSTPALSQAALPVAPVHNVAETFFGTTVDDPYRDLENVKDPTVAAWMKAHSDHAYATLHHIKGRDDLRKELERLDASAAARVTSVSLLPGDLYFYEKRLPQDDQLKLYMRHGLQGVEKLLFDPELLKQKTGKAHAINYYTPSPDGRLVAVGVSAGGSEDAAMRILDTATGKQLGPEIPRAQFGGLSWTPDSKQLYFHRMQLLKKGMPATEKYQHSTLAVMKPGASEKEIRTVLRAGSGGAVNIPATEFPFIDIQPDGRVLLTVNDGVSPDFRGYHTTLAQLQAGKPNWRKLFDREDGVTSLAVKDGRAYVLSFKNASRYRLLSDKLDGFSMARAQVLLPESQRVLTGLAATADGIYVEARDGNVKRLLRRAYRDDATVDDVPLPLLGTVSLASARPDLPGLLIELEGWTRARQIYAVAPSGAVSNTGLQPSGPYDAPNDIQTEEVMVKSHDGVMVPMSIIHKVGVKLDGSNPTMLYGYGSYGMTEEPYFSVSRLAWLNSGAVFAVANPRGSGVFGKQWHLDGKMSNKPNTWRDFIACAEYLVAQQWTSPSHLGIWGGSAGGILVGRSMTERPNLFAVVVSSVGLSDAVRMETTPNGVPNIPEFGTRTNEAGFRALLAMSTYHHIQDGVKYPAVLFTHGANDPRVEVWNSTKAAARLMAASSSGKPVLLRLNYDGGHGIGNTKSQTLDERADVFAFALWQMGVSAFALQP